MQAKNKRSPGLTDPAASRRTRIPREPTMRAASAIWSCGEVQDTVQFDKNSLQSDGHDNPG
jgi:hypothetical protein